MSAALPLHNGPNALVVATLTPQGLEEAVNTASFAAYLNQVLAPLQAGEGARLDNLRVHKAAGLAELVATRGLGCYA